MFIAFNIDVSIHKQLINLEKVRTEQLINLEKVRTDNLKFRTVTDLRNQVMDDWSVTQ